MTRFRLITASAFLGWLLACSLGIPWGQDRNDWALGDEKAPATTTSPTTLADQVLTVFVAKCAECHSPDALSDDADEARQQITNMTDLTIVKQNVKPGDLEGSRLWKAVKPMDGFMPPDSAKQGKLSAEQIEIIRRWILAGAPVQLTQPAEPAAPNP